MTAQHEAWHPTIREFSDLVRMAADDEFNSARCRFSQWSFWRTGHPHACLCEETGRFYIYEVGTPTRVYWASKDAVLAVLGIVAARDPAKEARMAWLIVRHATRCRPRSRS